MAHPDRVMVQTPGRDALQNRVADLAALLPAAMLLFVAAAFVLPTEPSYALAFYACVIPPSLAWLATAMPGLSGDRISIAAAALILWSGLTLLWGHDDGGRSAVFAGDTAATLLFALAAPAVFADDTARRRLGTIIIWLGAADAILSVILSFVLKQDGPRIHGWGVTRHPILGASVMTAAYITALYRALAESPLKPAHLAAAAAMAVFIMMTESRGPLLAGLATTLLLCAAGPWRWRALPVFVALLGAWFLLPAAVRSHQAHVLVERGSSRRFEIWDRTLALIADRPLFGHGLAANVDVPGITFPHNLYISVLFYSGAVGVALFAALLLAVTWRLWRAQGHGERLWMAALWLNALMTGLTDIGQITKGPGPLWFIFWLPVGLIAGGLRPSSAAHDKHRIGEARL